MIVPMSLAGDISTAGTRRFALTELRDVKMSLFPQKDIPSLRVFRKAKLSTMILEGIRAKAKRPESSKFVVRVFPADSFADDPIESVASLSDCRVIDAEVTPIALADMDEWALMKRMHTLDRVVSLRDLSSELIVERGEINRSVLARYLRDTADGCEELLRGAEVAAFERLNTMSQGEREWLAARELLARPRNRRQRPPERRLATQRITGVDERQRVVAAVIEGPVWFADSTNSIKATGQGTVGLEFMEAILNSDLIQWRFRLTSTNNNVGTNELLALPIAVPNTSTKLGLDLHLAVIRAGDQVRNAKAELRRTSSASSSDRLMRLVARRQARLNEEVFKLYGLTADEIQLIKSRLARRAISLGAAA